MGQKARMEAGDGDGANRRPKNISQDQGPNTSRIRKGNQDHDGDGDRTKKISVRGASYAS